MLQRTLPIDLGSPPRDAGNPFEAHRLATILRQRLWWLLLAPLLALAATFVHLMTVDPRYEVATQLLVQFGPELAPTATAAVSATQPLSPQLKRPEDTMAEVQILKDPQLVTATVAALGEAFFYPEHRPETLWQQIKHAGRQAAAMLRGGYEELMIGLGLQQRISRLDRVTLALQSTLQVEAVQRSDVIEIKLPYPSREAGVAILQAFVDRYLARRSEVFKRPQVSQFLSDEALQARNQLVEARSELAEARAAASAWSTGDQRRTLIEARARLEQRRSEASADIAGRRAEIAALSRERDGLDETINLSVVRQRNAVADDLRVKRLEHEMQLEQQRARFGEGSREAFETRQRLERILQALGQEPEVREFQRVDGANALRQALVERIVRAASEVTALESQAAGLQREIARIDGDLTALGRSEARLDELGREVTRRERLASTLEDGVDKARIIDALAGARVSNVAVMAPPSASIRPVSPRVGRLLLIALAAGFVLAGFTALAAEALAPRVRSDADLASLFPEASIAALPDARASQ